MTTEIARFYKDYNGAAFDEGVANSSVTIKPGQTKKVSYYFETDETTFDINNAYFRLPATYGSTSGYVDSY